MQQWIRQVEYLLLGLSLAAAAQAAGLRADCPALNANLSNGAATISLGDVILLPDMQFYFADGDWNNLAKVEFDKATFTETKDGKACILSRNEPGICNYSFSAKWSDCHLDFTLIYEIPAESKVSFSAVDLYLAKDLFYSAKRQDDGKPSSEAGQLDVTQLKFTNNLGTFSFHVTGDVPWRLRDTSGTTWKAAEQQTLSLLNLNIGHPKNGILKRTVSVRMDYIPSPDAVKIIQFRRVLKIISSLAERKPAPANLARVIALQNRLAQLIKTGRVDDQCLKEAEALARKSVSADSSYRRKGVILPNPQVTVPREGKFTIDAGTVIVIPQTASVDLERCATLLSGSLKEQFNLTVRVCKAGHCPEDVRKINLAFAGETISLKGDEPTRSELARIARKPEGYLLKIFPNRVMVIGNDARGLFFGTQSLMQLLEKNAGLAICAPCTEIYDWPDLPFRGMFLEISNGQESYQWMMRALAVFARNKFNVAIIGESDTGTICWNSHPEIANKGAYSPAELKKLVEQARTHFMEAGPLIQSLGHSASVVKAHPELAEAVDGKGAALCMTNPATRKFLSELYDEAISIYHPRYFHIGMDEATSLGVNPRGKGIPPATQLADHVGWCYNYLKQKGINNIIIWHDTLLEKDAWPERDGLPANSNSNSYGGVFRAVTHPAVKKLPTDLIIAFWSYWERGNIAGIPYFQQFGYRVVGSPWFAEGNCYDMGSSAYKNGALGVLGTTWTFSCVSGLPTSSSLVPVENSWSVNNPKLEDLRYDPARRFQGEMLPPLPSDYVGTDAVPVDIAASCNHSLAVSPDGWTITGGDSDQWLLPEGVSSIADNKFHVLSAGENRGSQCIVAASKKLGDREKIPPCIKNIAVGKTAKSLLFLQTCIASLGWDDEKLGSYTVHYENGKTVEIPVVKMANIVPAAKAKLAQCPQVFMTRRVTEGLVSGVERVRALTKGGSDIYLQSFEWVNPMPKVAISSIDLNLDDAQKNTAIILLAISAVN